MFRKALVIAIAWFITFNAEFQAFDKLDKFRDLGTIRPKSFDNGFAVSAGIQIKLVPDKYLRIPVREPDPMKPSDRW